MAIFGSAEILMKGSVVYLGVPFVACPGTGIKTKKDFLSAASKPQLKELMGLPGAFTSLVTQGQGIMIPPAYMVMTATYGHDIVEGLRWGFFKEGIDKAIRTRTLAAVENVISECPGNSEDLEIVKPWRD